MIFKDDDKILENVHKILYLLSVLLLLVVVPFYFVAVCKTPGHLKKKYDFMWLVDKMLSKGLHLDNLCVYDEVLKSETSFHC